MADSDLKTTRSPKLIDLSGQAFGRLQALSFYDTRKDRARWLCRCSCGTEVIIPTADLRSGHSQSCGCLRAELKSARLLIHGHAKRRRQTLEWQAYIRARARCRNSKNPSYCNYGGRGIQFRFSSYEEFFKELGYKPDSSYSLDRIDNNGHYEIGNVRWATRSQQNKNRRPSRKMEY